jgi:hypothetical protein
MLPGTGGVGRCLGGIGHRSSLSDERVVKFLGVGKRTAPEGAAVVAVRDEGEGTLAAQG